MYCGVGSEYEMKENLEIFGNELKSFSHNASIGKFSVSTKQGIHLFNLQTLNIEKTLRIKNEKDEGAKILEMDLGNSMVGYVTKENKFVYFDMLLSFTKHELTECREVLGLKFTKDYVVLIFDNAIDVYHKEDLEKKFWTFSVEEEKENDRNGVTLNNENCLSSSCSVSYNENIFGMLSFVNDGDVCVLHLAKKEHSCFRAHKSRVRIACLNKDGSLLATASTRGTLIRIFDVKKKEKIYEVRRGSTEAEMYSICFSEDSKYLSCYSSRGTVHIFSLEKENLENRKSSFRLLGYVSSYLSSEWSKIDYVLLGDDPGKCFFDPSSNSVVYVITKAGYFNRIRFTSASEVKPLQRNIFKELQQTIKEPESLKQLKKSFSVNEKNEKCLKQKNFTRDGFRIRFNFENLKERPKRQSKINRRHIKHLKEHLNKI